jgi:uncharacterized protein (DUF2141 family)
MSPCFSWKCSLAAGVLALLTSWVAAQPGGTLEIMVAPVHSAQGAVRLSLYRDAATFRKEAQAVRVIELPAQQGVLQFHVEGLEPGRYAAMVYHDENANQKLDLRFGMFPTEGYGLSQNPKVIGPPKFEDSAFEVKREGTQPLRIEMRY